MEKYDGEVDSEKNLNCQEAAMVLCSMVAALALSGCDRSTDATFVVSDDGIDYVALGDSAASAPLVPDAVTQSPGCDRSTRSYAAVLTRTLGDVDVVDVSCAGATTPDVVDTGQSTGAGTVPPQIDAAGPRTDLITIAIGGNDADLVSIDTACTTVVPPSEATSTCSDRFLLDGVDTTSPKIAVQAPTWSAMIDALKAKAPNARIVLFGHGTYLRPGGASRPNRCTRRTPTTFTGQGRRTRRQAIAIAADHGIDFFGTRPVTIGHDICAAPEDRYIEGYVAMSPAQPLHTTRAGAIAIAAALAEYLS